MTTPQGLSDAAFDRVFQVCSRVRLNDYPPKILRAVFAEVLLQTDPGLAAHVRGLSKTQFQGLLDSLRTRRAECSLSGVG
jgi:hypothetical protein